jgi:coproporphyrinogen III oxidase-like Fe-S oxidoreductase
MQLMCHLEIDKRDIERNSALILKLFRRRFAETRHFYHRRFAGKQRGQNQNNVGSGKLIIRNVAMCFDAYLAK